MGEIYQIDSVDRKILNHLIQDARKPFLEIARELVVSGGTIHQRVDRMKKAGLIEGSTLRVNLAKCGLGVTSILGVNLTSSREMDKVIDKLKQLPEVVEAHYTTGHYALLLKIHTKDITAFHKLLTEKIQKISQIQSTESFISMDTPINRSVTIN